MHLREIKINGFTSYATDASLDNISPGVNIVVGRNGAGKSNFFRAIQFVLGGPKHNDLKSFRSFGSKNEVSVELVLANTGKHFYNLGNTVSISRVIGSNGNKNDDKYFVDDRHVTKTEITSLLNAAGLSTDSGSYYIVPQGSIHQLASATDEEMLTILCNACGAASFDERIAKSRSNLKQASEKIEASSAITAKIDPIVNRMARDVENLQERRHLMKEIRGTQYLLNKMELLRTQFAIERESGKREKLQSRIDKSNEVLNKKQVAEQNIYLELNDAEAKLAEIEADFENAERELNERKHELNSNSVLEAESIDVEMASVSEIDDDEEELRELISSQGSLFASSMGSQFSQMSSMGEDFDDESEEPISIEEASSKLQNLRQKLIAEVREMSLVKSKLLSLQLKEGRAKQLSPEQYAEYQRKETERVEKTINDCSEAIKLESGRLKQFESERTVNAKKLDTARAELRKVSEKLTKLNTEQAEYEQQRTEADSLKSNLFLSMRKAEIQRTRQSKAAEQQLKTITGGSGRMDMATSIEVVQNAARELNLSESQYFGTLAEVLDINSMVTDVVDRLALRQLFFHVVDSSDTVSKLVKAVGNDVSATFVPLNELIVPELPQYPTEDGVTPLMDWVTPTEPKFTNIRNFVFGKYVVCESLTTAMNIQSKYNLPAVTLDGDICDTSGTISGGFSASGDGAIGNGDLRINAIRELAMLYRSIGELDSTIESNRASVTTETQRAVQCSDKINNIKVDVMHATITEQNHLSEVTDIQEVISLLDKQIADCRQVIIDSETELSAAKQEKDAISQKESFASELTQVDRDEMDELNERITELTESCQKLAKEEVVVFTRRMRAIHKRNKEKSQATNASSNDSNTIHLKALYNDALEKFESVESALAKAKTAVKKVNTKLESAQESTAESAAENKELITSAHQCTTKISVLNAFSAKVTKELEQLGTVPQSSIDEAAKYSEQYSIDTANSVLKHEVQRVEKLSSKLQKELDELEPVDPKVASDREKLVSDLEQLQAGIESLNIERDSVIETINTLEYQKSSKLTQSLTQISAKFSEIFTELSGGHTGELVLERDGDSVTNVHLNVSFGDSASHLSGGQRTVCALAIILAIQSMDSAPFYIFDEIDSNLDTQARTRVAEMISNISKRQGLQFICTTFHPELVSVANECFGVSFQNKRSTIEPIERKMALEFTSNE